MIILLPLLFLPTSTALSAAVPLSPAAAKFESMLNDFRAHTPAEIDSVPKPRMRGLLKGVSAAMYNDKVTTAFEILYEDLGPVRMAGDLVFSKLETEIRRSKDSPEFADIQSLDRQDECVTSARRIFDAVDVDSSGTITQQELLESDLFRSLGQCQDCTCGKEGTCQSVQDFMDEIDTEQRGELHFSEFMIGAHSVLSGGDPSSPLFGGSDSTDILVDEMLSNTAGEQATQSKAALRFDGMCEEFASWSDGAMDRAESRNPRLAQVLDGCFAGAEVPAVVEALKILYVDFGPLRLAGNLIFKIMKKLAR